MKFIFFISLRFSLASLFCYQKIQVLTTTSKHILNRISIYLYLHATLDIVHKDTNTTVHVDLKKLYVLKQKAIGKRKFETYI